MKFCPYCTNKNAQNAQIALNTCEASTDNGELKIQTTFYSCRNGHYWSTNIFNKKDGLEIEYIPPLKINQHQVSFTTPGSYRRFQNSARNITFGSNRSNDPVYSANGLHIRDPRYLGFINTNNPTPSPETNETEEIAYDDIRSQ